MKGMYLSQLVKKGRPQSIDALNNDLALLNYWITQPPLSQRPLDLPNPLEVLTLGLPAAAQVI